MDENKLSITQIKDKNKFLYRQLLLEEILAD